MLSNRCPVVFPYFLYTKTILKLELDNIELSFNSKKILRGIYLSAETGKVTGILGRNGCGKTSLLRILFGSLNAKYGIVRLDGIHQKKKLFKTGKAVYLPQHRLLPNSMTLQEAFEIFTNDWAIFITLFPSFALYQKEQARNLSTGELRLLETYLVLSSDKKIILLDEPFSFISPVYINRIKAIIAERKTERIIIVTDHFYNEILDISDTLFFIKNGCSKIINSAGDLESKGYLTTPNQ